MIIQSTTFCNLDCSYCYLPLRDKKNRFDLDLIPVTVDKLVAAGLIDQELTVAWHAGEPLVMPVDYYREAVRRFAESVPDHVTVTHNFQTNGMLISEEYVEFFKEIEARIGVSIDGPKDIHDARRTTRDGRGTYDRVMAGFEKLRAGGLQPATIAVLTEHSLGQAERIYDFFKQLGVAEAGFNIEEIEGENESSSLAGPEMEKKVREFYRTMHRLVMADPEPLRVREIVHGRGVALASLTDGKSGNSETNPLSIISIGHDGRVSTFSPELLQVPGDSDAYTYGDIRTIDFTQLWRNNRFIDVYSQIEAGIAKCAKECRYFNSCGGGVPANKLAENGSFNSGETMHCRLTRQALVDTMEDDLIDRLLARKAERLAPPSTGDESAQPAQRPPRVIQGKKQDESGHTKSNGSRKKLSQLIGIGSAKARPQQGRLQNARQEIFPHLGAINLFAPTDRITLSPGTQAVLGDSEYTDGARIPIQEWRSLSDVEYAALSSGSRSPAPLNFVALVQLPEELQQQFALLNRDHSNSSSGDAEDKVKLDQFAKDLIKAFGGGDTDKSRVLGIVAQPGQKMTSTIERESGKLLGLHVDSWVSDNVSGRSRSQNRIAVNLGEKPRHLLMLDLGVEQLVSLMKEHENDEIELENPTTIARRFMERHPSYPVLRLEIRPGEAYIAATENIVHDAASMETDFDAALHILGEFPRSKALKQVLSN
ncbi:GRRM system radical SAM/SPASM domain protein [Aurantiacibacter sp. MUD11]|uniref:cyclophane-forming radical SAM/SPASM peptide maturase GrrM/OscB n=1 Tax=Aurantiacibacter sp. MUD11 TaxID=3003265 RepID=UPI0022AB1A28|nr:cyclophane-forming radical SAM/SPASM peptide maturase GrrM/OscB [Aurantiacibacter sp. MUD11]WAT17711.1 GRRM system radical SAM/SPASM domain protein [Aurantiacibacter sp. MUD11]